MPPDRTKEEIEQIRKDFLELKKLWDNKIEKIPASYPNPFNDKTRMEEIEEHMDQFINLVQGLLNSGKIKSCEALTVIEKGIRSAENTKENPPWWARIIAADHRESHRAEVVDGVSLDEIVEMLKKLPYDDSNLNNALDKIGTSACTTRASIEEVNPGHPGFSSRFRT